MCGTRPSKTNSSANGLRADEPWVKDAAACVRAPGAGGMVSCVLGIVGSVLFVVVLVVVTFDIDRRIQRRRRRRLIERFPPYQPRSVADGAQRWLGKQQH
jgi:hypothetical protein